jgi:hypothetical protein
MNRRVQNILPHEIEMADEIDGASVLAQALKAQVNMLMLLWLYFMVIFAIFM